LRAVDVVEVADEVEVAFDTIEAVVGAIEMEPEWTTEAEEE
jgi:hypothetical protein